MRKKILAVATCVVLALATAFSAAQSHTVEITEQGFRPESLKLRVNVSGRLTFVRRTDKTCVREVVIQEYGVKRELPLNEPVTVEITPRKSGEVTFACGMGMLRGKLVVE